MKTYPLELSTEQAAKLVHIIKRGSDRSGILVMKSLAASLAYTRKVKEQKSLDEFLGL